MYYHVGVSSEIDGRLSQPQFTSHLVVIGRDTLAV